MSNWKKEPYSLVQQVISVLWAEGQKYHGVVTKYNSTTKKHTVLYEDGEVRTYDMERKVFWLEDGTEGNPNLQSMCPPGSSENVQSSEHMVEDEAASDKCPHQRSSMSRSTSSDSEETRSAVANPVKERLQKGSSDLQHQEESKGILVLDQSCDSFRQPKPGKEDTIILLNDSSDSDIECVMSCSNSSEKPCSDAHDKAQCHDQKHRSELEKAIKAGDLDLVRGLLVSGADMEMTDKYKRTALMVAVSGRECHGNIVAELLALGAAKEHRDNLNDTPLIWAARYGHHEAVKLLLMAECDMEAKNHFGQTALILAAQRGHVEVVRELLERGANVEASNHEGETALTVARKRKQTDVLKLFEEKQESCSRSKQEEKKMKARKAQDEFLKMLSENTEIDSRTCWRDAKDIIFVDDPRFFAVADDRNREDLFKDFITELGKKEKETPKWRNFKVHQELEVNINTRWYTGYVLQVDSKNKNIKVQTAIGSKWVDMDGEDIRNIGTHLKKVINTKRKASFTESQQQTSTRKKAKCDPVMPIPSSKGHNNENPSPQDVDSFKELAISEKKKGSPGKLGIRKMCSKVLSPSPCQKNTPNAENGAVLCHANVSRKLGMNGNGQPTDANKPQLPLDLPQVKADHQDSDPHVLLSKVATIWQKQMDQLRLEVNVSKAQDKQVEELKSTIKIYQAKETELMKVYEAKQKEAEELICNQKAEIAAAKGKLQEYEAVLKKKEREHAESKKDAKEVICKKKAEINQMKAEAKEKQIEYETVLKRKEQEHAESKQEIAHLRTERNNAEAMVMKLKSQLADKKDVFKVLKGLMCKDALAVLSSDDLELLEDTLDDSSTAVKKYRKEKEKRFKDEACCCICFDAPKTVVLLPCKHLCVCEKCSKKTCAFSSTLIDSCPICREKVNDALNVYSS